MWRVTLVFVAACGSSSAPTPAPARTGSAAPQVAWQECTEAARARMESALVAREGLERLDAQAGEQMPALTCVTMQLGREPGFFVELVGRRDGALVRTPFFRCSFRGRGHVQAAGSDAVITVFVPIAPEPPERRYEHCSYARTGQRRVGQRRVGQRRVGQRRIG